MRVTRAVITAASRTQRALPLQRVVDRDGVQKSVLRVIVEEVLQSGIEAICVVVSPGDEAAYAEASGDLARRLTFIAQPEPRGYGEAIFRAREFVGELPFLHLVGDHLYVSRSNKGCAQQLVEIAQSEECSVSAVQPSRESLLPSYGTVGGRRVAGRVDLYQIERVIEKPTPTAAEQLLMVPGLRVGHYLCFFGMHVLTPAIFTILEQQISMSVDQKPIQLSPALNELAHRERYLALANLGRRYDVGGRYGLLAAQLALALEGQDRDEVLTMLVESLALRKG